MTDQTHKPTSLPHQGSRIGVFDSGVGGLSILIALRSLMPAQPVLFVGDQAHVPYGPRPLAEVLSFSHAITQFLLDQGAEVIVVACNAASAAALQPLRKIYPHIPFVGMEPAVKPAAEQTNSGVVGVLATPATFQGALYASVVERFAADVTILQSTCLGLVQQIEDGNMQGAETRKILEDALFPMMEAGLDTVVLGCTHYPFVIPLIQSIVGEGVRVINPADAVARQTRRLLQQHATLAPSTQPVSPQLFTTGSALHLQQLAQQLIQHTDSVTPLCWDSDSVVLSFCENRLS